MHDDGMVKNSLPHKSKYRTSNQKFEITYIEIRIPTLITMKQNLKSLALDGCCNYHAQHT
jgi:hypothetical protein